MKHTLLILVLCIICSCNYSEQCRDYKVLKVGSNNIYIITELDTMFNIGDTINISDYDTRYVILEARNH